MICRSRAALVAACLTATPTMAGNPNATLIYYDAVSNQTLDPQEPQNNSSFAQGVLMSVYDSLVRLDETGEPKPGLATSWQYNTALTEFTMKLRPNVTFHDGTKFDAAAAALNFARSIALANRAGAATVETMSQVAAVETEGGDTIRLKLKAPSGQMPYLLGGQAGMMISPAALAEGTFGGTLSPIGSGPY